MSDVRAPISSSRIAAGDIARHSFAIVRRGYDVTPVRAILPAVRAVMSAVRAAGGLVVHTRQGYRAATK